MARRDKRLERMRGNPHAGWTIADVAALCLDNGISCSPPRRGDHFKISHPSQQEILTVPAHRPVKGVYIRKLVKFVEDVLEAR